MIRIAPSLLAADFSDLKRQIALVEEGGADWLHLDIMDGHFVPNLTIGPPVLQSLRKITRLPFDTHLMIDNPDAYLETFRSAGADIITVHAEVCPHLHRTIQRIKELGALAGVSINPATPVSHLREVLGDVDLVLVMSVNPGFGGQSFIPNSLKKIADVAEMIRTIKPAVHLEVDGGVSPENAGAIAGAGATVLVAGSAVFHNADIPAAVRTLREKSGSR